MMNQKKNKKKIIIVKALVTLEFRNIPLRFVSVVILTLNVEKLMEICKLLVSY